MVIPQKIVEGLVTKADKIRALDKAGFSRTGIAQFLDIRYQHVRNTLVQGQPVGLLQRKPAPSTPRREIEPWPVERLFGAGFEFVAQCELLEKTSFSYSALAPSEAGVYAFAVNGFIKYVGLTRFGLRTRLGHYVYGHAAQATSARIKGLILEALNASSEVQVLVARPPQLEWNGLPVDGPAGLETGLIRLIKPEWNQQGNR